MFLLQKCVCASLAPTMISQHCAQPEQCVWTEGMPQPEHQWFWSKKLKQIQILQTEFKKVDTYWVSYNSEHVQCVETAKHNG